MIDSTESGDIVDQRTAWSAELVIEHDAGGQGEKTLEDALPDTGEGTRAVAFEGQDVLAGPKDRLNPLADRGEVHVGAGLVGASGTHDRGMHLTDSVGEIAAGIALIAQEGLATRSLTTRQQLEAHLALVAPRRGQTQSPGGAVGGEDRVQPEPPKKARMRGAPAIAGGLAQRGARDGLAATCTFDRGRVDEQQIVGDPWTLGREDPHQPLDRVGQTA